MNSRAAVAAASRCATGVNSSYIFTMACDQWSRRGVSTVGTPSSAQITATEYGWA